MYYPPSPPYRQAERSSQRIMTVTGIGTLSATPTIVKIQLGVVTEGEELTKTQQENAQAMNNVIQSLNQMGIPSENIQTVDYYIYPQYDYVDGKQEFKGYQVTHMISVTIENLEETGTVIDTAVKNGANRVSNIQFTIKDPQEFYAKALREALNDCVVKAQTMADTLNLNLDPTPIKIVERVQETPSSNQTLAKSEAVAGVSTKIEPGQLEIIARVEAQFQYFSP
ncbi:DUF541 domain-containing protein [Pontibacillus yanchengensis]|uniref:DUF541 domain-containing protein n=2 Tax=Pontibacillus yanchengensis TaxID=462910 RepID=A0ACC7VKG3_9BACI|nr:SIMPL domain-containing protein [Pontibacillus yanchengensis]MYL35041.1 DUF541 domain-containing protein [Pontibacillus yanchengensis]MYL55248.1 DUF541 domain-containing protein [Pontibacillus yanchengensis]